MSLLLPRPVTAPVGSPEAGAEYMPGPFVAAVALNAATSFAASVMSPRLDFGLRSANMPIK
jgi:hypothetical protein